MSINESKKYPSYNNFPFEEIPDYQTNYADLQGWHKDIGEMLKKRTLNSIIEDYGKGKNSTRKLRLHTRSAHIRISSITVFVRALP